jgi:hypothetical protein
VGFGLGGFREGAGCNQRSQTIKQDTVTSVMRPGECERGCEGGGGGRGGGADYNQLIQSIKNSIMHARAIVL